MGHELHNEIRLRMRSMRRPLPPWPFGIGHWLLFLPLSAFFLSQTLELEVANISHYGFSSINNPKVLHLLPFKTFT